MQHEDRIRVTHMLDACQSVLNFSNGKSRQDLAIDEMFQFALVRAIEIIGEAAGRVSQETQLRFPEIPWREAVGIRNRLVHAYFDVDLDVLWKTVQESIPELRRLLANLLAVSDQTNS